MNSGSKRMSDYDRDVIIAMYFWYGFLFMKKVLLSLFVVLLCGGAFASTYFLLDHKSPSIEINGEPTLACSVSFDDLMKFASASDEKALKSFFIEEKSLNTIADNGYVTYVAIDEANHVSKKQITVKVEPELKQYHIDLLKPLRFQVNEKPVLEDYVRLRNACDWDEEGFLVIDGIDYNKPGTYDVTIRSKKHSDVEHLQETAEVSDLRVPKIILNTDYVERTSGAYFDDEFFMSFVDDVLDDLDVGLKDKVECDWMDVLNASQSGYVSVSGTYMITYTVSDSEENTGKAELSFRLRTPAVVEESQEG